MYAASEIFTLDLRMSSDSSASFFVTMQALAKQHDKEFDVS